MPEEVTPPQFPLSLSATLRQHFAHIHTSLTLPTNVAANSAVQDNTAVELPLPKAEGSTYCPVFTEHTNRCTFTECLLNNYYLILELSLKIVDKIQQIFPLNT
jgi:hypothetical protein